MTDIGYDLNDGDIEKMISILKVLDEANANARTAIDFLLYIKKSARTLDPQRLEEFYGQFKSSSKS